MAWNSLTFVFGSKLTSLKLNQLQQNFAAIAEGQSSAPRMQPDAIPSSFVNVSYLNISSASLSGTIPAGAPFYVNVTLNSGYSFFPNLEQTSPSPRTTNALQLMIPIGITINEDQPVFALYNPSASEAKGYSITYDYVS